MDKNTVDHKEEKIIIYQKWFSWNLFGLLKNTPGTHNPNNRKEPLDMNRVFKSVW